jgi:hypothetical protein
MMPQRVSGARDWARKWLQLVLPLVPVTPMVRRCRVGSPKKRAAMALARWPSCDTAISGRARPPSAAWMRANGHAGSGS